MPTPDHRSPVTDHSAPVLILAAGEASRWDGPGLKQHLEIDGERLLDRIVCQCRDRGRDPIVVTRAGQRRLSSAREVEIIPTATTSGGILATQPWWGAAETIFLLSDVRYTDAAMDAIILRDPGSAFFTDGGDIFALRIEAADYETLRLLAALTHHLGHNQGRIWEIYRRWHGLPAWPVPANAPHAMLHFIGDETQDFDCLDDFNAYLAGRSKNIMHNPPPETARPAAIDGVYRDLLTAPTDIRTHLPLLRELATGRRVTEFGTRRGISTCALVAGRPLALTCYDLKREPDVDRIAGWAQEAGVPFTFHEVDLDTVKAIDPVDVLFIDAMHNGNAVAHYLALGAAAGMTTCALHDTEIFGHRGDLPGTPGIMRAVTRFLQTHPTWRTTYHSQYDYGFTVIAHQP